MAVRPAHVAALIALLLACALLAAGQGPRAGLPALAAEGTASPSGTAQTTTTGTPGTASPAETGTAGPASSGITVTPTGTTAATPGATSTPLPTGAGGRNIVKVVNKTDNALRADGRVQLTKTAASNAEPINEAYAYSSCSHCQTFAVALQVALISTHATIVQPQNVALAVNYHCTACTTVADAYQYVFQVNDPTRVPGRVQSLINRMNQELRAIRGKHITAQEAETRIDAVITQFRDLAAHLQHQTVKETRTSGKHKRQHH